MLSPMLEMHTGPLMNSDSFPHSCKENAEMNASGCSPQQVELGKEYLLHTDVCSNKVRLDSVLTGFQGPRLVGSEISYFSAANEP